MKRRTLIASGFAAGAATLGAPRAIRASAATTLRFIPEIDLAFVDPVFTTATVTRDHALMVFDMLYGVDGSFQPVPQMVAGHRVEEDGRLWTLTLRDGLLWHDGERVLARDCVASIRRWARRDPLGDALMAATLDLSAPDDRTIRFRLARPFPLLPTALGKPSVPACVMMPERFASTDPFTQVTTLVGSGPYRFKGDERVPGAFNAYERFDRYVPRADGNLEWTSGPKVARFDRVEWTTITDTATAAAALQRGEQDWWHKINHDLGPLLRRNRGVKVEVTDTTGVIFMLRPNHLQPPFDNPEIRRALLYVFDQTAFMQAIVGDDRPLYHVPAGVFCPGTPMASDAGMDPITGPRDPERAARMIRAAGYRGEPVVLMAAEDYQTNRAIGPVAADAMRRVGLNVEYVSTDWSTLLTRRSRKDPPARGGWSLFITGFAGNDQLNPSAHLPIRGVGEAANAWPGWARSERLEQLRDAWFLAPTLEEQQRICREMQVVCLDNVNYYPLGQLFQPTAYRTSLEGVLPGFATFWNVRRAA